MTTEQKLTTKQEREIKNLATKAWNRIVRDLGYMKASLLGLNASKMTEKQLMEFADVPFPSSTRCPECGQELPPPPTNNE